MMDMLSQRYACPFFVLDEFIRLEQLHEFLCDVMSAIIEEKKDQYRWEFYLHKVYDMSYADYLNSLESSKNEKMTETEIKDVVNESQSLLDLF